MHNNGYDNNTPASAIMEKLLKYQLLTISKDKTECIDFFSTMQIRSAGKQQSPPHSSRRRV